jgi:integrase
VGWQELTPWLQLRTELPVGPLFCVLTGPTRGRHWSSAAARAALRDITVAAGVGRRFVPHQLRHAHAVELAREAVPLLVIQRQLGHSNLGITSAYLEALTTPRSSTPVHSPPRAHDSRQRIAAGLNDRRARRCSSRIAAATAVGQSPVGD